MSSTPGHAPVPTGPAVADLHSGAGTYGGVLLSAGGRELDLLARGGARGGVCVALYSSPPYDLRVPALSVARLSVNLVAGRVSGGLEGERRQQYQAQRHSLFLTPAGAAVQWRKEQPSRHLNIYFQRKAFADDEDGGSLLDADDPLLNAFVPGVQGLADELAGEVASHDPMAAEAADSLARLLLVRVLRRRINAARTANPLSGAVMRRLHDYVAEHLAERILVADLAAVAGLSPDRFAHAYSRHAGHSPHQFVLAARLRRAQELLSQSGMGIAEVAATCGFASQQHLTQTMKRRLSTTPARYRQGLKPTRGL